jgi:pyruvate dehydrogenase E1 component alpha subunit
MNTPTASNSSPVDPGLQLRLYETMVLIRAFEELVVEVYAQQDMKTPVHLSIGQEAVAAGVCEELRADDYLMSTHRNHAHCLAKGVPPMRLYAEFYGRTEGCAKGRGGSMHPVWPELGILGTSAIVGGGIPLGVGTALASALRGDGRVSAVFFGDGASEEGAFHESLNFAALRRLPVLFVCENNFYATASPLKARQPNPCVFERVRGFGIPGAVLDGNDVLAVHSAASKAVAAIRAGGGPQFLECRTYRWKGHVGIDEDTARGCRPGSLLNTWKARCPLERQRSRLLACGVPETQLEALCRRIDAALRRALDEARSSAYPDTATLGDFLFRE